MSNDGKYIYVILKNDYFSTLRKSTDYGANWNDVSIYNIYNTTPKLSLNNKLYAITCSYSGQNIYIEYYNNSDPNSYDTIYSCDYGKTFGKVGITKSSQTFNFITVYVLNLFEKTIN